MSWVESWKIILGVSGDTPQWIIAVCVIFSIYFLVIIPTAILLSYLERKVSADLQARVGPNQAGPVGFFQPIADVLKLLQKKSTSKLTRREGFWFSLLSAVLFATVAVLPLGGATLLIDSDMSVFLPFWAVLVLGLGSIYLGFSQGSVDSWFGGMRVAGQALSGAFPAIVCVICAGMEVGGFRWSLFISHQNAHPFGWIIFSSVPFQMIAFVVFILSGIVLLSISPLDAVLNPPELRGGVAANLNGGQLGLFQLGRFYGFFLWTIISVVLFCGGWKLPVFINSYLVENQNLILLQVLELFVLLSKTFVVMFIILWVGKSNPRLRLDQITDLNWKVLGPMAMMALVGTALWKGSHLF